MKVAIMQPYFFPYVGYFQLIKSVDQFVVYDNIRYTKKGWINRNRFLQNGKAAHFTVPIKKGSDRLDVRDRTVASDFDKKKLLQKIREAYRKAPYFERGFSLFERVVLNSETNLFGFIYFSIREICKELGLETEVLISSSVDIDHSLKSQDKVIAICEHLGAAAYVNPIGGQGLYSYDDFRRHGIDLKFIRTMPIEYQQLDDAFVPWLSILDVMMFNDPAKLGQMLDHYEFVTGLPGSTKNVPVEEAR